jgi:poly-gamma-glutamate synthesis protein (capsule biosynthesis protein)
MGKYTEQGMIARVDLTYDPNEKQIMSNRMTYVPTWVDKYHNGTRNVYAVVPLVEGYENNPDLTASGHANRAGQALTEIHELLGAESGI